MVYGIFSSELRPGNIGHGMLFVKIFSREDTELGILLGEIISGGIVREDIVWGDFVFFKGI